MVQEVEGVDTFRGMGGRTFSHTEQETIDGQAAVRGPQGVCP